MNGGTMRKGWTLLEVLVVTLVVAMLTSLLMPTLVRSREAAFRTTCMFNVKQLGMAIMMYQADFGDAYPMAQYFDSNDPAPGRSNSAYGWTTLIHPYVKAGIAKAGQTYTRGLDAIYRCPRNPQPKQTFHYGVHEDLFLDGGNNADPDRKLGPVYTSAVIPDPSLTAILMDKGTSHNLSVREGPNGETTNWPIFHTLGSSWAKGCRDAWGPDGLPNERATGTCYPFADTDPTVFIGPWPVPGVMPRFRHEGRCTVLFADGSVRPMLKGALNWRRHVYIPDVVRVGSPDDP